MKDKLLFRMAARCEAAGRPNNEDNYQVSDNLAENHWGFTADKELSLGDKGALLVVCDGMGGMNAGEVASAIAVDTIKQWFAADRLTDNILESSASIQRYLVDAIQAADAAIKADGAQNPEHDGMGSTIVMAWLLGQKVYVGWCGDSRAYRYNAQCGLQRLSHDHSYVQELVDAGKLSEELAFDHPNNNIITRSLGDPRGKARPDTKEYDLCNEDIILLCSDGLCGCLRDNEIEAIVKNNQTSLQQLRDALWKADEEAGWHDNVTIALAQVISGGAIVTPGTAVSNPSISSSKAILLRKYRRLKMILGIVLLLILCCVAFFIYQRFAMPTEKNDTPSQEIVATENEGNEDLNNSDAEIQETPQNQTEEVKEKSRAKESTPREKTVTKPDNKAEEKTSLLDKFRLPHKDEENVQVQIVEEPKSLSQEETKKEEVVPTVVTQEVQPNKEVKEDTKEDPNVTVIQESDTSVTLKIKK